VSAPGRSGRLVAIDALRGVAVLLVLGSHLLFARLGTSTSAFPDWTHHVMLYGQFGVHLFLVLSGFCIHMQWARSPSENIDFVAFWRRRLHRLYPPYFVALCASVAGLFVLHSVMAHETGSIPQRFGYTSGSQFAIDLVLLLLLVQNVNGASHRIGNGPFWTLALEEQLYLLYFPLLWLRRRFGWTATLGVVVAVCVAWRTAALIVVPEAHQDKMFAVGPARWVEWALGAIAVEAHMGRIQLPRWASSSRVGILLLGITVVAHELFRTNPVFQTTVDPLFGLGFFVLVNAACRYDWGGAVDPLRIGARLAWVGGISYSLYLTHEPILVALKHVGFRAGLGVAGVLVLRALGPLLVAWLFFTLVERRFLNSSRRKMLIGQAGAAASFSKS